MALEPRRSSRANKGKHTGREAYDYSEEEEFRKRSHSPSSQSTVPNKRRQTDDTTHNDDAYVEDDKLKTLPDDENLDEEGDVRCLPCGTNKDNYDEETDEGGTMIECDSCKTWQHAKCMGYRTARSIPKNYICNVCKDQKDLKTLPVTASSPTGNEPSEISAKPTPDNSKATPTSIGEKKSTATSGKEVDQKVIDVFKNPTRKSVAKAFYNVFKKNINPTYTLPEGYDSEKLSNKWSLELEGVIFRWANNESSKKYVDKSRSLMVSIKKPAVITRIIENELSFDDIVNLSPEEIDSDLKKYAEKVRRESIRRSVLTVDDNKGQRIRRTHKGEEIVEDTTNQQNDYVDVNIMTRNIDHRRFSDEPSKAQLDPSIKVDNASKNITYTYVSDDDEEDEQHHHDTEGDDRNDADAHDTNGNDDEKGSLSPDSSKQSLAKDRTPSAASDISDDELDFILKGKPKATTDKPEKTQPKIQLPPILPNKLWSGKLEFPDLASFDATGVFHSCSNYKEPVDINSVIAHNRFIKTSRDIFSKPSFTIEGRLDRSKADTYLDKIIATRDLYLVEIKCSGNQRDYDKVCKYLTEKSKVGVLSDKPSYVKDSYLVPIDGNDPNLKSCYKGLPNVEGKSGLYGVYVVKKDFVPAAPSILKKSPPLEQLHPSPKRTPSTEKTTSLDTILNKLSGSQSRSSGAPVSAGQSMGQNGLPSNLTNEQLAYLSDMVKNAQDPQAMIQLIQQQAQKHDQTRYR